MRHHIQHAVYVYAAVVIKVNIIKRNPLLFERMRRVTAQSYRVFKRIIRLSGCGNNSISHLAQTGQRKIQRMCSGGELRPHQCILRKQCMCKQPVQRIPARIIVTIAGRWSKMPKANVLFPESGQYSGKVHFRICIYPFKNRFYAVFGRADEIVCLL